jgi:hypothetical protein
MSYHLSCERHCMAGLDDYSILQPGHLVESRLEGTHDSISIQNLSISWLHMLKYPKGLGTLSHVTNDT